MIVKYGGEGEPALGSIPTERLRRRKQLGSVSFYVTIPIQRRKTSKENFAIAID